MHGLIFVTFENFVRQEFGQGFLTEVRNYAQSIGAPPSLLIHNVYPDDVLFRVVAYVCEKQGMKLDDALKAYGRYYITNELTGYQCSYLLQQTTNARDLLLTMRNAHSQMHSASEMISPPLFGYESSFVDQSLILVYANPRKLCSLLQGAIEGAAQHYGEQVVISEICCMKRGHQTCRFHLTFHKSTHALPSQSPSHHNVLADLLLATLPADASKGVTLQQLPTLMMQLYGPSIETRVRPNHMYQAITLLLNAGLASSTPNVPIEERRYWRAPQAVPHRKTQTRM